jgi:glycerol-3-phosphate dehydrogenase
VKKGSDPFFRPAEDSRFDLIVIGGGINGAAIAREAAVAGNAVLVLEREDFGSGTSAASTRLIHGGLRYLEHAEISLVRESLAERERLLQTAPHLVEPLEIFLPQRRGARRGRLAIRLGLSLYDLLSLGKSVPGHRILDRDALLAELPGLETADLVGGAAYFDAQVCFPERLVLENLLDAAQAGASVQSHTAAADIRVEDGRVRGVAWTAAGRQGFARAPVVVNAAGPWVDEVLGGLAETRLIGGTKGSHLIASPFETAPAHAVYAEAASDGRPFFIIPWNGLYLIGTTDERYEGDPGRAAIESAEAHYLIDETRRLFPRAHDLERRIRYAYAGIRPLPATRGVKTGAITRRHLIKAHRGIEGLYSIVGGKLTTHRALAADCLRRLRGRLPARDAGATALRLLPGALRADERAALLGDLSRAVGEATAARLWRTYGGRARRLLERAGDSSELRQRLGPGSDYLVGELVFAIEEEWAVSLADILMRRTMAGLDADSGRRAAPLAADWLVRLGLWDKRRAAEEIAAYRALGRRFAVPLGGDGAA